MKGNIQKILPVLSLLLAGHSSVAAKPSKIMQSSCLLDEAASSVLRMVKFSTNFISEKENYSDGYDAIYYFMDDKTEIGYGEKSGKGALIYAGKTYPFGDAKVIAQGRTEPSEFSPALASWSRLNDASGSYLCVNFNFDGIGRSGSFQNFKGGYLLDIGSGKHHLYYIERDVRAIRRAMPRH
jgi:hypothetical protein